jgi:hypothetical protein
MKVNAISDYFTVGYPVLHLMPDEVKGAYLHTLTDTDSVVLSIAEDMFRETDNELEFLMNSTIEIGAYEENNDILLLAKIGPNENPYIYPIPFDSALPENQFIIGKWIESRFIVVTFIDGEKSPIFRGIRILGIPNEIRDYVANKWIKCIKQGFTYHLKYASFLKSTSDVDPLELWNRACILGKLEI